MLVLACVKCEGYAVSPMIRRPQALNHKPQAHPLKKAAGAKRGLERKGPAKPESLKAHGKESHGTLRARGNASAGLSSPPIALNERKRERDKKTV